MKISSEKKKEKNFLLRNNVTLFFAFFVVLGIFISKETPYNMMNELVHSFTGYSLLVISLLIPVIAGMGFNFSIVIGAIAGQFGVIVAVNWELSGILGFLTSALFATFFAVLFGILTGVLLNKARGHEMITSWFVGYLGGSIYAFILLTLMGSVIPIKSSLLLSGGVGLKNTIDLKGTFLHSVDGLVQVQFFLLLIIIGILFLGFDIYHLVKKYANFDKKTGYTRIALLTVIILMSSLIMYGGEVLPKEINELKNIQFPMITGMLICAVAVFTIMITRTKLGQDFIQLSLNVQNSTDSNRHSSKVRITAIVISTTVAAWGQIILLQNSGSFSTYGSHLGIGLLAVSALVVGGATISKATVRNALLGIILLQGFYIILIPAVEQLFSSNVSESLRVILINGAIVYTLIRSRYDNQIG